MPLRKLQGQWAVVLIQSYPALTGSSRSELVAVRLQPSRLCRVAQRTFVECPVTRISLRTTTALAPQSMKHRCVRPCIYWNKYSILVGHGWLGKAAFQVNTEKHYDHIPCHTRPIQMPKIFFARWLDWAVSTYVPVRKPTACSTGRIYLLWTVTGNFTIVFYGISI